MEEEYEMDSYYEEETYYSDSNDQSLTVEEQSTQASVAVTENYTETYVTENYVTDVYSQPPVVNSSYTNYTVNINVDQPNVASAHQHPRQYIGMHYKQHSREYDREVHDDHRGSYVTSKDGGWDGSRGDEYFLSSNLANRQNVENYVTEGVPQSEIYENAQDAADVKRPRTPSRGSQNNMNAYAEHAPRVEEYSRQPAAHLSAPMGSPRKQYSRFPHGGDQQWMPREEQQLPSGRGDPNNEQQMMRREEQATFQRENYELQPQHLRPSAVGGSQPAYVPEQMTTREFDDLYPFRPGAMPSPQERRQQAVRENEHVVRRSSPGSTIPALQVRDDDTVKTMRHGNPALETEIAGMEMRQSVIGTKDMKYIISVVTTKTAVAISRSIDVTVRFAKVAHKQTSKTMVKVMKSKAVILSKNSLVDFFHMSKTDYCKRLCEYTDEHLKRQEKAKSNHLRSSSYTMGKSFGRVAQTAGMSLVASGYHSRQLYKAYFKLKLIQAEMIKREMTPSQHSSKADLLAPALKGLKAGCFSCGWKQALTGNYLDGCGIGCDIDVQDFITVDVVENIAELHATVSSLGSMGNSTTGGQNANQTGVQDNLGSVVQNVVEQTVLDQPNQPPSVEININTQLQSDSDSFSSSSEDEKTKAQRRKEKKEKALRKKEKRERKERLKHHDASGNAGPKVHAEGERQWEFNSEVNNLRHRQFHPDQHGYRGPLGMPMGMSSDGYPVGQHYGPNPAAQRRSSEVFHPASYGPDPALQMGGPDLYPGPAGYGNQPSSVTHNASYPPRGVHNPHHDQYPDHLQHSSSAPHNFPMGSYPPTARHPATNPAGMQPQSRGMPLSPSHSYPNFSKSPNVPLHSRQMPSEASGLSPAHSRPMPSISPNNPPNSNRMTSEASGLSPAHSGPMPSKASNPPPYSHPMPSRAPNVPPHSSPEPSDAPNVPPSSRPMPSEAPNVPPYSPPIPSDAPNVPQSSRPMPSEAPNVPPHSSPVPSDAPNVPQSSRPMPSEAPNVPPYSRLVPSDARNVQPSYRPMPSEAPNVPPYSRPRPSEAPSAPQNFRQMPSEAPDVASYSRPMPSETADLPPYLQPMLSTGSHPSSISSTYSQSAKSNFPIPQLVPPSSPTSQFTPLRARAYTPRIDRSRARPYSPPSDPSSTRQETDESNLGGGAYYTKPPPANPSVRTQTPANEPSRIRASSPQSAVDPVLKARLAHVVSAEKQSNVPEKTPMLEPPSVKGGEIAPSSSSSTGRPNSPTADEPSTARAHGMVILE